ncbi:hypothetical protein HBH26_18600 [Sphingomonas sp. 36D10-4-7]|uniref:2-dehydropantoate 2-reductase n=2 Tax=Sphingomonas corticis TaxID=2722791 RepID=A0ABX1CST6_9SPHN|nr:hypothetical protein [Sphingomonas corticis]
MAAKLARAGRDVSVIARGAHLERIRTAGLTIRSPESGFSVRLPASGAIDDFAPFDVVIVTAKAPGIPAIARAIGPHLGDDAAVLFATNGIQWFYAEGFAPGGEALDTRRLDPDGDISRLVGAHRSFGVVVRSSNVVVEPGVVSNSGGGSYALGGALPGGWRRAGEIASLLDVDGARFTATPEIRREMWGKLVRNTAVALLCGLTHATPGEAFSDPGTRPLARLAMREVSDVAAAHGFRDLLDLDAELDVVSRMTAMRPSLVQDLELGRTVELDAQVLIVRDFARQAGVDTPTISALAPVLEQKARLAGCY